MSTVWISVVEIYNDQIYDVLAMKKDKQERVLTAPLKLAEEGKGCFFIKNMQEILVRSADEAYQVIQVGYDLLHQMKHLKEPDIAFCD